MIKSNFFIDKQLFDSLKVYLLLIKEEAEKAFIKFKFATIYWF